jgi:tetratricopeptide (TPR) repeat protein
MLSAVAADDTMQVARRLVHAGEFDQGARLLRQRLEEAPSDADALELLGEVMLKRRQWQEGEAAFAQALFIRPDSSGAQFGRGFALRRLGRVAEAIACFEKALHERADSTACLAELGAACLELGDNTRAESVLRVALQRRPDAVDVLHVAARMHMAQGDRAAAVECLQRLLATQPLHAAGQYLLARLEPGQANLPLERLQKALESDIQSPAERRDLAFAVALRLEHAGRFEAALEAYQAGNDAQLQVAREAGATYDPARREQEIELLTRLYSPGNLRAWQPCETRAERLIFVVGMPRSGTTLTEQLLASHRAVHGAGERPELAVARRSFERLAIAESGRFLTRLPRHLLRRIGDEYVDALRKSSPPGAVLVDKNPHNFENIGLIRVLFPHARIIHCERDPLDTCLSNFCQVFSVHHSYKSRFADLAHYYGQYRRLMRHWQATCANAIHALRYESLVAAPERELRALLEFCGLEWDPACLDFHLNTRPVNTPSQLQVRQPLYATSLGRARRHYGSSLAELERMLREACAG